MTLRLGQTISHYRIVEHIGEGGMGVIYRAFDTRLNRQVAIKALHEHLTREPSRRERFMREAHAAAALNHPYIATVHEVDEVGANIFIVMEFVDGRTLRSLIKGERMVPHRAARLAAEIAEGLAHAHASGIVHRDLKPENIIVRPDEHPKLLDFGVAKVIQEGAGGSLLSDPAPRLTQDGKILGTVGYMSPEQARGESVDARSDIFAFGVVLYEMLTGEAPFKGSTGVETLSSILKDEPTPAPKLNPEVSPAMQGILERCLSKDPAARYQKAEEVVRDLREAGGVTTVSGSFQEAGRAAASRKGIVIAAASLLVAVGAVAAWSLLRSPSGHPAPGAETPAAGGDAASPAAARRSKIVVLPFENLGPAEDAYFAEGMTEEITSRLAVASGLGVISRTSAFQYDRHGKSIADVGRDLGVQYVLEGTVRWARAADGTSRVRITPQLVRVADDTHMWADTLDREIDDIFLVQAEIAESVIEQLGVVLRETERTAMGAHPTESFEAHQAYLRGLTSARGADMVTDPGSGRAVGMFEKAVELDPGFALAWAELGRAHSLRYHLGYDRSEARREAARSAVERAVELDRNAPEVRMAMGFYRYWALKEYDRALEEFDEVLRLRPNWADAFSATGYVHRRQGRWDETIQDLTLALELNPIDLNLINELGSSLIFMRHFERAEQYLDRSVALQSDQDTAFRFKALNAILWKGDLRQARAVFEGTFTAGDPSTSLNWYQLLLLEGGFDAALEWARSLPADLLADQSTYQPRALLEAHALRLMGETEKARGSYRKALEVIDAALREAPSDHRLHSARGVALAALGKADEAVREGREGLKLYPTSLDAYAAPERIADMARIHVLLGDLDGALEQVEALLSIPSLYSSRWIRLDPLFSPVVEHPGFADLERRLGA